MRGGRHMERERGREGKEERRRVKQRKKCDGERTTT